MPKRFAMTMCAALTCSVVVTAAPAMAAQTIPAAYMYTVLQVSDSSSGYNFVSQHDNNGIPFLIEGYGDGSGRAGIPDVGVYIDNFPLMHAEATGLMSEFHVAAQAGISYAVGFIGPDPSIVVPIRYSALLSTSAPGSERDGVVAVAIANFSVYSNLSRAIYQAESCSLGQYACVAYPNLVSANGVINLSAGYFLSVSESVSVEGGAGTSFNARAFADPYFEIDPDFAQTHPGYSLIFSPNVQNNLPSSTPAVPEPATWAMMIAGFGMIGGAMRRRVSALTCANI